MMWSNLRKIRKRARPLQHQIFSRRISSEDLWHELTKACLNSNTAAHLHRQAPLRASAMRMIPSLSPVETTNPLGFHTKQERKRGTLLDFVCTEKEKHPDKIILCRVGEFFEAFGVDALLLVEHCGLNQMGQKARAGCPKGNVQQTLDGLTGVGLTVAVYEEMETGALTRAGLKQRYLGQVVSPSSSTYFHNSTLGLPDVEFRESLPFLGLQVSSRGSTSSSTVNDTITGSRAEGSVHYTVYEVNVESLSVRINERLTEDAAKCLIETTTTGVTTATPTLYYAGPPSSHGSETRGGPIPTRTRRLLGDADIVRLSSAEHDPRLFLQDMLQKISTEMASPSLAIEDSYRILGAVDDMKQGHGSKTSSFLQRLQPRPLYSPTAQQLGLLPSPQVPDLVRHLLPKNDAPPSARNFFRRWMLRPPPPIVADKMRALLYALEQVKDRGVPVVRTTLTTHKLVALCSSNSANAAMFRDLHRVLSVALAALEVETDATGASKKIDDVNVGKGETDKGNYTRVIAPLVDLVAFECGVGVTATRFQQQLFEASLLLSSKIRLNEDGFDDWLKSKEAQDKEINDHGITETTRKEETMRNGGYRGYRGIVAGAGAGERNESKFGWCSNICSPLVIKNEMEWRSAVLSQATEESMVAFGRVNEAREMLFSTMALEFGGWEILKKDGKYDTINNSVYLMRRTRERTDRTFPGKEEEQEQEHEEIKDTDSASPVWVRPRDRNGKQMPHRWTTKKVEDALSNYLDATEEAKVVVRSLLRELCLTYVDKGHMISSVCAISMNEILSATSLHVREYTRRRWSLLELENIHGSMSASIDQNESMVGGSQVDHNHPGVVRVAFSSLRPYWLPYESSVANDIDLRGQWIVTGPNMSGKSTLLRSVTAAALLANCGLAAPATTKHPVPRLDGYFLRTNGADCPAEGLSAFALEADDIRILMRDVTPRSLAAVDELGRGTAPREGAAIVGAVLEELDQRGCPCLFATHLHEELESLPLSLERTQHKVLTVVEEECSSDRQEGEVNPIRYVYRVENGICDNSHSLATATYHGVGEELIQRARELRIAGDKNKNELGNTCTNRGRNRVKTNLATGKTKGKSSNDKVLLPENLNEIIDRVNSLAVRVESVVKIAPEWDPPPTIADEVPCVYILEVNEGKTLNSFYIGETEHLADRMRRHRNVFGKQVKFAVFPVGDGGGRTEARKTEASAIVEARKAGIMLHNIAS